MSTNEQTPLSQPMSVVRNTLGKEPVPQDPGRPIFDEAWREYCDRNYHQILPIIAEKVHQEKAQQEKLKAVKAHLNFEETSHHSETGTPIRRRGLKERLRPRHTKSCHQSSRSITTEPTSERRYNKMESSRRTEELSEREGSARGHWKSKVKRPKSSIEDDLSQPWVCEETDPFTPQIRYFDFPKTRMPSHIKTYDGSEDPEDHLKDFQSAAKTERWTMPTWCHMFNSTLTINARRDRESTEEFMRRYKLKCRDVKGAPECMKISGFMNGITNPKLTKRLHDKISKSVDEMMRVTTAFLQGEVAASNRERKKSFPSWKQQEANQKQNFKKGGFRNQQRSERKQDHFALLTKTPKEIFALDKGKFKAPPPMTTPVEKRNANKFCEFHGEVGHNTDECMHLRKQIEEMLKAGKLSHLIKEIKQNNRKEQPKVTKKGETAGKDKAMAILMVQPWERVARQRITQSFSPNSEIFFPPLGEDEGTEGPMIIEAEIGGHCMHRMYVDGGSASEILYEHCFSRLRSEIKKQLIPATTPLIGFSGEIIWPIGQIQLLVTIRDEEHSASALMNFVVVRLKILVEGGVITLKRSRLVPLECAMVSRPERTLSANESTMEERIKVVINPEYLKQTIMIGSTLTEEGRNKLCSLLQQNLDVFAWKPTDMTGFPRHIAEHRLNVRKGCSPIRQKKRGQAADRNQEIQEEVGKLVEIGIMREVHYHDWLSNLVMVKKHDNSWRMCVDFKDLNKACPKDGYLLSKIDWKIGRNLEVYVDDLVIKSRTEDEIVRDMEETFQTLREINMKLNPKKCTFGIEKGMFLGYKVSTRGLKICSDKVDVVLSLPSPKCLKDVQRLNVKLAKAEEAFKQMKQLISELPMLVAPIKKEDLIIYLATAKETVSAVLMTKQEAKQMPIYFVSRALRGPEVNYTSMEKLVLALVHASKRLKRYFRAHPIIVITDQPIQHVLSRPKVAGRLQKWSIELGEYAIHYRPRVSVKGKILADFIVERPKEESPDTLIGEEEELPEPWILFDATNSEAEYEALIAGLKIAKQMGVKNLQENVESRLVANQVNGTYVAKETDMV
ncbi:reverse transcriptase domain-containing protein [Tanacetum coccineum]